MEEEAVCGCLVPVRVCGVSKLCGRTPFRLSGAQSYHSSFYQIETKCMHKEQLILNDLDEASALRSHGGNGRVWRHDGSMIARYVARDQGAKACTSTEHPNAER